MLFHRTSWVNHCLAASLIVGTCSSGCSLPRTAFKSPSVTEQTATFDPPDSIGGPTAPPATEANQNTNTGDLGIRLASSHTEIEPAVQQASPTQQELGQVNSSISASNLQGVTLAELEAMAIERNPSLQQLAASICKAEGFRNQVGLRPNPVVGYQGMQLADRGTDQHTFFVERELVTGNKLELNRRVQHQALEAQKWELETQRYRVLTDLRLKYFEAYAIQQRLLLLESFQAITTKGMEMAELRKKGMEGSQLEVLQAGIQRDEIALTLQQSRSELNASLQGLIAIVGEPCLSPQVRLQDPSLENATWNWDEVRCQLISGSPELQVAYHRLAQAQANVQRQHAQPLPNLTLQLAGGVDNGTNSGMMNVQVGAPIPTNNKNQGNILAAHAEVQRASAEIQRLEGAIASRLAEVARDYDTAAAAVRKYEGEILPKAEETIRLAEKAYQAGEYTFIEILTVRKTYFDANLKHLAARMQLAQAQVRVDGFMLTGAWDATLDYSTDDGLRGQAFSQQ